MVKPYRVEEVRNLTGAAYILRFSKNQMKFRPGQHLVAGIKEERDAREYSIYSGSDDDYLEILVREVESCDVSRKLRMLKEGDELNIKGPYGFFMSNAPSLKDDSIYFIASGTGIAPFHSFVKTYPDANYTLIHGIRNCEEAYERTHYRQGRYIACTSRDEKGDFHGRLTEYIKTADIPSDAKIFLCGNSQMITDSMQILEDRGFSASQMFTEVYF